MTELRQDLHADYDRALEWLFSFANYETVPAVAYEAAKFDLDRMRRLLSSLGTPQEKFQAVHIAGTKGKGSTAAICESILRTAGHRTGLYTSPHLHTFRERIRVDGALITPQAIVEGVARLQQVQPSFPDVSVFELMTALAFDYFARTDVQIAVVEVGIGGRLDATNIITPGVSVITSISYDHTTVLGNTLAKIAREKAGIIKPNVPVVSEPQVQEPLAVIEQIAQERNAPLTLVGRDWKWQLLEQNLDWQLFRVTGEAGTSPSDTALRGLREAGSVSYDLRLHLLGEHQLVNATTAIAAALIQTEGDRPLTDEAVRAGVENARWPGRFEVVERSPYLVLDGAHNGDSARRLVSTLDGLLPGRRVRWIFGASSDKDVEAIFDELLPRSSELIITRSNHPRAADPLQLAGLAAQHGARVTIADSVAEALDLARQAAGEGDLIVVTGSLFVVAQARALALQARGEYVEDDA